MSFILLETFSVYDFEAHLSKFQELRRQLVTLDPPERFTPAMQVCLFLNGLRSCKEFAPLVTQCLLRSDLDVDGVIELSRDFYRTTSAEGFNAMYAGRHNDDMQADKSSEEQEDSKEGED